MAPVFRVKRPWNWNPGGLRPEFEAMCSKLVLLLPMWEGYGDAVNLIDRKVLTKTATTTWGTSPVGMAATRAAAATDDDHFRSVGAYQPINSTGDYTIWGTANPPYGTTGANNGTLFSQRITGSPFTQLGIYFNFNGSGTENNFGLVSALHIGTGGTVGVQTPDSIIFGEWHSFCATKRGTTLSIYVDGVFQASATIAGSANDPAQYVTVGGINDTDFGFGGSIGLVAAWNRALSSREIATLETNWIGLVERRPAGIPGFAVQVAAAGPTFPNAVIASSGIVDSGAGDPPALLTDIDDADPDAPDGLWWTAKSGQQIDVRLGFATPGTAPDGLQIFKVRLRKTAGAGTPTVTISLYEGGTLVRNLVSGYTITSATGQTLELPWDIAELADQSGASAEIRIVSAGA